MSKADCNYKYKNGKLEKIEIPEVEEITRVEGNIVITEKVGPIITSVRAYDEKYTKNCEKAKEIIKKNTMENIIMIIKFR